MLSLTINLEGPRKFLDIFVWYIGKKFAQFGKAVESIKNLIVDALLFKRGRYGRIFLHGGMIFIIGAVLVSAPILASSYPILGSGVDHSRISQPISSVLQTETAEVVTQMSEKPRDSVVEHRVAQGETLSQIAKDYGVSVDSIKWLNSDVSDFENLSIGLMLKIPPVTGVIYKVESGDDIYSLAKKYKTNPQKIVDFPFNRFLNDETFDLVEGQTLVIPDGVQPEVAPFLAQPQIIPGIFGTPIGGGSGQFLWPTTGVITQYFTWYHSGIDIADPSGPTVVAAEGGRVVLAEKLDWGYGWHVIIDHGGGVQTLYGHLQEIYVSPDPAVSAVSKGQAVGRMGSTGRSTGTHLHFEVRVNGTFQNPLSYLK